MSNRPSPEMRLAICLWKSRKRMFPEEENRRWEELSVFEQNNWKAEGKLFLNDMTTLESVFPELKTGEHH